MHDAGIDITIYKPHSLQSASVSAAYGAGCSVQHLLNLCGWSNQNTFAKFYLKDITCQKPATPDIESVAPRFKIPVNTMTIKQKKCYYENVQDIRRKNKYMHFWNAGTDTVKNNPSKTELKRKRKTPINSDSDTYESFYDHDENFIGDSSVPRGPRSVPSATITSSSVVDVPPNASTEIQKLHPNLSQALNSNENNSLVTIEFEDMGDTDFQLQDTVSLLDHPVQN